jgi:hypothetical protein
VHCSCCHAATGGRLGSGQLCQVCLQQLLHQRLVLLLLLLPVLSRLQGGRGLVCHLTAGQLSIAGVAGVGCAACMQNQPRQGCV